MDLTSLNTSGLAAEYIKLLAGTTGSSTSTVEKINLMCSLLSDKLSASNVYMLGIDESGNIICANESDDENPCSASVNLISKSLQDNVPLVAANVIQDSEYEGDPEFQRFNISSALCVPFKAQDETPAAVIYADSRQERQWNDSTIEMIRSFSCMAQLFWQTYFLEHSFEQNKQMTQMGLATLKLSHYIKNILQMLSGSAEVIDLSLERKDYDRITKSWSILKPNIERMRRLTLEMLDYGKEYVLDITECNINEVIEDSIKSVKQHISEKQIKVQTSFDCDIPAVMMDSERISKALVNFMLNALDSVEAEEGVITIETIHDTNNDRIQIIISDNGANLTDEQIAELFTPHEPESNTFSTGLGMAIGKQIIERHNGSVETISQPDKGNSYRISFGL